MAECRSRLKNRAMLRNLTRLVPIIENGTRWSGKYQMLARFNLIYDELRCVSENESSTVAMNFPQLSRIKLLDMRSNLKK